MMLLEVQATGAVAIELPLRKIRNYFASWKFSIGDTVCLGNLTAAVIARSRSAMGREVYSIWVAGENYGRPLRSVLAASLT